MRGRRPLANAAPPDRCRKRPAQRTPTDSPTRRHTQTAHMGSGSAPTARPIADRRRVLGCAEPKARRAHAFHPQGYVCSRTHVRSSSAPLDRPPRPRRRAGEGVRAARGSPSQRADVDRSPSRASVATPRRAPARPAARGTRSPPAAPSGQRCRQAGGLHRPDRPPRARGAARRRSGPGGGAGVGLVAGNPAGHMGGEEQKSNVLRATRKRRGASGVRSV